LVFEEGKGKDKDGKKRGKKNGETKIILNACCLTLSYFFKF
jgi:hypothetical protein